MRATRGDVLEAIGVGLLVAGLVAAIEMHGASTATGDRDDRPDHAILREVDLTALAEGDAQTVGTAQGETIRLTTADAAEEDTEA
ncbi:hypothetical protein [Haloarcula marina]|uniref:hypothetical protein n=1 Tax=Haloarcula marina TaxID=2961574 RepID=UPI0020B826E0|nr:hypothetical protein [Halomicroarcula marina]